MKNYSDQLPFSLTPPGVVPQAPEFLQPSAGASSLPIVPVWSEVAETLVIDPTKAIARPATTAAIFRVFMLMNVKGEKMVIEEIVIHYIASKQMMRGGNW